MRIVVFIAVLVVLAGGVASYPGGAAAKSARYANFDVALVVRDDGSWLVTETQTVEFEGGPFARGYRSIPLARTTGITDVTVAERRGDSLEPFELVVDRDIDTDNTEYTFNESGGSMDVRWTFGDTYSESRTFVVSYVMNGALRSYPDQSPPNQQVWFTAVGSALSAETPIDNASVSVSLPAAVSLSDPALVIEGPGADEPALYSKDGQTFVWESGAIGSGDELTIRMQFPPLATAAPVPAWQTRDDEQRAREEKNEEQSALIHLMMLAAGLLFLAGGSVGGFGAWYTKGRDPHTGLVADFVPSPPDDLPPGVAGALLDEVVHERDIVATILDLARRGVISMAEVGPIGAENRKTGDYLLKLERRDADHPMFEQRMLNAIFGVDAENGAVGRLSQARPKIVNTYPVFRTDLYEELVKRGLFNRSPEATRKVWGRGGLIVAAAGVAGAIVGLVVSDWWVLIPAGALVGMGLVYRRLGKAMPRKTAAGAEKAATWAAFKRYLDDIEKYEKLDESQAIFDRYLAFTTAFGIEESWLGKFARVNTPAPTWFEPDFGDVRLPRGPRRTGSWGGGTWVGTGGGSGDGGGIDLPDFDMPDLQKTSNKGAQALQGGSSGLMDVLKVAGAIIEIASAFSGGGGKGGSSGGGGGGFS